MLLDLSNNTIMTSPLTLQALSADRECSTHPRRPRAPKRAKKPKRTRPSKTKSPHRRAPPKQKTTRAALHIPIREIGPRKHTHTHTHKKKHTAVSSTIVDPHTSRDPGGHPRTAVYIPNRHGRLAATAASASTRTADRPSQRRQVGACGSYMRADAGRNPVAPWVGRRPTRSARYAHTSPNISRIFFLFSAERQSTTAINSPKVERV